MDSSASRFHRSRNRVYAAAIPLATYLPRKSAASYLPPVAQNQTIPAAFLTAIFPRAAAGIVTVSPFGSFSSQRSQRFSKSAKMVKLGNNFCEKNNAKPVSEDGFDTIPLITPLDVNQLQFPPPEKVVVKTKTDYNGDHKKGAFRSPKIAEFTISVIEGVSERLKVTLLVICALAFLVCVVFLVVYKVYQYEQPCPEGFIYTQNRCMPAGVYSYYPPQGPGGRGRLFTIINHYNLAKQTITRSVSPWMTVMAEEKVSQQETETSQKLA